MGKTHEKERSEPNDGLTGAILKAYRHPDRLDLPAKAARVYTDVGCNKMKKKIIFSLVFAGLIIFAYCIGEIKGSGEAREERTRFDLAHWKKLAALDRSFLTNIVTQTSALKSGTFIMEVTFPGRPTTNITLDLVFSDGKFDMPKRAVNRAGLSDTLVQKGSVVSWMNEGVLYEANAESVGLIDGDVIWGRIYGWNPGDESIGVWRIYPKPIGKTSQPTAAASPSLGRQKVDGQ